MMNNSTGGDRPYPQAGVDASMSAAALAVQSQAPAPAVAAASATAANASTPLIELKQLRKSFTKANGVSFNAIDNLDLRIERDNHLVAVIGPDGSGKSTLLQILAGIMIPDGGWYALNLGPEPRLTTDAGALAAQLAQGASAESLAQGVAQAQSKRFGRKEKAHAVSDDIGYMSQTLGLYEDVSVWDNLKTFSQLRDLDVDSLTGDGVEQSLDGCGGGAGAGADGNAAARLDRYLEDLLTSVNLIKFKDYKAGSLSGGMKQKLALTCALSAKPKLLLLDEPTVGVDPISRRELWNIIFSYIEQSHSYCIFSSLYLEEAERSSLTIFIKDGKIIYQGQVDPLKQQVKAQCFALHLASHLSYQKLARALMINLSQSKLLRDLCPRMGRIDLLTAPEVTLQELDAELQALLAKCYRPLNADEYSLQAREPILEDAYINLTGAQAGQAMTSFGADYEVHGIPDSALDAGAHHAGASGAGNGAKADAADAAGANGDAASADVNTASAASPRVAIDVQGVRKQFGNFTAVADSNFQVYQGEIFGLLGPNGAGKTTTFRMICALLNPTAGKILIQGLTLANAKSSVRATIGYVAQKFCLYRKMTLRQNLSYFGKSYGLSGKLLQERMEQMCEIFDLTPFLDESSESLPFGVQRSLSMACALIHRPSILFLDEATSGADPTSRRVFWQLISQLAAQGTTIIVTTHFMEEAEYCDRFLIQDQGKILILGTPDEICDPKRQGLAKSVDASAAVDATNSANTSTAAGAGAGAAAVSHVTANATASAAVSRDAGAGAVEQGTRISIEEAFIACVQNAKAQQAAPAQSQTQAQAQGQRKELSKEQEQGKGAQHGA